MPAAWIALQSELRGRWREWLTLALVVVLFSGSITAIAAGARRTDSAYQRFLVATRAPDILVFGGQQPGSAFARFTTSQLASLPEVAKSGRLLAFAVIQPADVELLAPTDSAIGSSFWTKKLIAGRLPNPDRGDEVAISFALAQADHLGVGDNLQIRVEPIARPTTASTPITLHIVGIDAAASEFPPANGTGIHAAWATPAFARLYGRTLSATDTTALRLKDSATDPHVVLGELSKRAAGHPVQAFTLRDQSNNTQRSIHLQAVALWILAGLLALIAILILTQLFARQSWLAVDTLRELHFLGMTTRQLWYVGMIRVALIGAAAAVGGVVVAILASPLLPLGLAGVAEPNPGLSVDTWALLLGAVGILCVVILCGALPNWWAARNAVQAHSRYRVERRPIRLVAALLRWGSPAPLTTGVAWALQPGPERTAAPVRTTIAVSTIGIAALTGAFVFSSSLGHLLDTPSLYGVSWDAEVVSSLGEGTDIGNVVPALHSDTAVSAIAEGYAGVPVQIGPVRVDGLALSRVSGASLLPRVLAGRMPERANEVLLGSRTLTALHAHIGSKLKATLAGVPARQPLRVVGRGVFPTLSDGLGLGQGAGFTTSTLLASLPQGNIPPPDTILIRFHPGLNRPKEIARLNATLAAMGPYDAIAPDQPVDLVNFGRVSALPIVVGALLTLVAVTALGHLVVTAIRRRRTDLAVLKVIGFLPRQLRTALATQASTTAIVALLFGVPLGIVLGRAVWSVFAHQTGVVDIPIVPWATVAMEVAGTLVLANLIALLPARRIARMNAADALRAP